MLFRSGSREKDIQGHLRGDREDQEDAAENDKKQNAVTNATSWWNDVATSKDENLSPKMKLLKGDFQVYQAFNYLKTWKTLKVLTK